MSTESKSKFFTNEKLLSSSSDSLSSLCTIDSKSKSDDSLKEIWEANKKDSENDVKNSPKILKLTIMLKIPKEGKKIQHY